MKILVIEVISNISNIEVSEINNTSEFKDLGFDIIGMAELIMILEDKLKISVVDDLYYSKTVGELIEQIKE